MKLLHIDSSVLGENSVSRQLGAAIVDKWKTLVPGLEVQYRDLNQNSLPHLSSETLGKTDPEIVDEEAQVLQEFMDAEVVVLGAPMYNFGVASTLKAWIDRVAVAGKTFRYTAQGPEGLAGGKRVIVVNSRGSVYAPSNDFQTPYLRHLFNFMGITDIEFIYAEGVALSPEHRKNAVEAALASLPDPVRAAA